MGEILTRCGYRCDLCLAYAENIKAKDQRAELCTGWHKYFGLEIPLEKIICDGCLTCAQGACRIDDGCKVRQCVLEHGVEHCGQCDDYPCAAFEERRGLTLEQAREKTGAAFSMKEYKQFVMPYDNGPRLDELRQDKNIRLMTNKLLVPDIEGMAKFIGEPLSPLFTRLTRLFYAAMDLKIAIIYGGRYYGWQIAIKKGSKPMVTITPARHSFTVLCVLGKNELELCGTFADLLSEKAQRQVESTPQFHDGKWVSIAVQSEADVRDVLGLFSIKRFGHKAREGCAVLLSTYDQEG